MKKLLLISGILLLACGCGKYSAKDVVNKFDNDLKNSKSYKLTGTMEIMNDEESFVYDLETYYLKDDYYKVVLVNQTNNHEQVILKNKEDVYVITPELNKSFKFQSEWPDNSSQAYLLNSLLKDLKNDKKVKLIENNEKYILKSNVNYPNNDELKYQKLYFKKNMKLEKVEVFDKNDIVKVKVIIDKVNYKTNLSVKEFKIEEYIDKEESNCLSENCEPKDNTNEIKKDNINPSQNKSTTDDSLKDNTNNNIGENAAETNNTSNSETQKSKSSSVNLDSVIYPLYIPSETYLSNSETIKTENGNRVILTFSGEKNFVIIEELTTLKSEMEVMPVYGDPMMLSNSIGALSSNSLTWDADNISYYLASTDLSTKEMLTIANSLGNSTLVAGEK